jgi:hypothetical protein
VLELHPAQRREGGDVSKRARLVRVNVTSAGSIYRWTFTYRETKHTGLATTPADAKRAGQKALREARHNYAWWCRWGSGETW